MPCEIDQSGKLEQTSKDTVLALSSEQISYSIKVPKSLKQHFYSMYDKRHKKRLTFKLFANLTFLLLEKSKSKKRIIYLDDEYYGHGRDIKNMILQRCRKKGIKVKINIVNIGKNSPAHKLALKTFRGDLEPDYVVTEQDLKKY